MVIAYKVYLVLRDILEFASKGNLPSELAKKRNKVIVCTISAISLTYVIVTIFLNIYWRYLN